MKNRVIGLSIMVLLVIGCSTSSTVRDMQKPVGVGVYSRNKNHPVIYKYGYRDYKVTPFVSIVGKDTIRVNELKFNSVYTCFYTKKVMYELFGNWSEAIYVENSDHPLLVWNNIKLFKDSEERYSVIADGKENKIDMYASVIVFNSKNEDCLKENSPTRVSLIGYFSNGIRRLNNSNRFYEVYWKVVNEHKKNKQ